MTATELKNNVLSDLNDILNMSIQEIETKTEHTIPELCELFNSRHKKADITDVFCYNSEYLPENWEIKHEQLTLNFASNQVPGLLKRVKYVWPNGSEPKHKDPTKKEQDFNCIELQKTVIELREIYYFEPMQYDPDISWRTEDQCNAINDEREFQKFKIIQKYKRSKPTDLIRLCWKFISDSENLEGVHFAWENPVVKFEPAGSYEVPEYMRTKTCVA